MAQNVKISIIMPIHNGEKYLRETLDCVVNQSFKDIELICVDDASTDNSIAIIDEYKKNDDRIQLYSIDRSNAGAARNYGMKKALGDYYLFWDCDDLFEPDACERMYEQITKDNADICVCNADHYDNVKNIYVSKSQYLKKSQLPDSLPFSRITNGQYIFNFSAHVAWNKLFKADFIKSNGIQFQEIPRINDHYFVFLSVALAESITVVYDILVHYRVNQSLSLTTTTSDSALCKYYVQRDVKNRLKELGFLDDELVRQSFINKSLNTIIHGLNIQSTIEGFKELYNVMKEEGMDELLLKDYGEAYYYNPLEYRNLLLILNNDYDEYLFEKGRDYRAKIEEKTIIINRYRIIEKELISIKNRKWYRLVNKILPIYTFLTRPFLTERKDK